MDTCGPEPESIEGFRPFLPFLMTETEQGAYMEAGLEKKNRFKNQ